MNTPIHRLASPRHGLGPPAARVVLCSALLLASGPLPAADANTYYEDAQMRFVDHQYRAALVQLKNALQLDPDYLPARVLAGRIYLRNGQGPEAEKELRLARAGGADPNLILIPLAKAYFIQRKYAVLLDEVKSSPRTTAIDAEISELRGRAHMALGEPEEAQSEFVYAASLAPERANPLLGLARVAVRRGALERAGELLDRATKLEPGSSDIWHLKAEILRRQKDLDGALHAYSQAIEAEPDHMPARIGRAATLIDLDRDQQALGDLEYVLKALPSDAQARYLKALVLARSGQIEKAGDLLGSTETALRHLRPEFVDNHLPSLLLFGVIAYAQKHYDQALAHLQGVLRINFRHVGARKLIGAIYLRENQSIAATEVLEPALAWAPKDAKLHALLAEAYVQRGRFERATGLFERAAELAPGKRAILQKLAMSRLASGDRQRALDDLETAAAAGATDLPSGLVMARLQLQRGNYRAAIKLARQLYELEPKNPNPYNIAGAAHLALGNLKAARAAFAGALRVDPRYVPASLNLAELAMRTKDLNTAKSRYRAILKRNPRETRAMAGLAQIAEAEHRVGDAIAWLEKLRAHNKDAIKPQVRLVALYLQQDHARLAATVARELTDNNPQNVEAMVALSRVEVALGKRKDAVVSLRRAVQLASYGVSELQKLARIQIELDDFEGAWWALQKAVTGDPTSVSAQRSLLELEIELGKLEPALERAEKLRKSQPRSTLGDLLTGDVLMKLGRTDAAIAAYRAAQHKEDSADVAVRLFRASKRLGDLEGALRELEAWVRAHSPQLPALQHLATGYIEAGDIEAAIRWHERLAEARPNDPDVLNNLAWLYHDSGDARALTYAERAHKLVPSDGALLDTLGWVLVDSGELNRGLEFLRKAQIRSSKEPMVQFHLGVALHRLGRDKEAIERLKTALKLGEDFTGNQRARALLARLSKG